MKLGRLPHDPTRPCLALGPRLDTTVPPNPAVVDWLSRVQSWPMYANDRYGDCVWAMIGHLIEAYTTYGRGATVTVTDQDVLKGYADVTGFNPSDPSTDQGTVIADALAYWQKTGVGGHKILAYAKVDHTNRAEVDAALNLFGGLCLGVNFPTSAMNQFNAGQPWDVVANDGGIEGGHAVHHGIYNTASRVEKVITWGAVEGMTDAWWAKYVEEAWVVISPEWLDATGHSPEGLDLAGLGEDFAALTGKPNPFPQPTPTPVPTPVPVPVPPVADADHVFAQVLRGWVKTRRFGANRVVQQAASQWLAAKNLE